MPLACPFPPLGFSVLFFQSVEEVPFPAVTVDSGEVINPWGYLERAGSLVELEAGCQDEENPSLEGNCYDGNDAQK